MRHKNRARMNANEKRRGEAAKKQEPLPDEEQQRRATKNEEAKSARYPYAPAYKQPKFGGKGKI